MKAAVNKKKVLVAVAAAMCFAVADGFELVEDFSVHAPDDGAYGILVERNSNLSHGHGWIEDGCYRIPVEGCKHLLATPPLGDFHLELDYALGLPPRRTATLGVVVFFRYDRASRKGHRLEVYHGCDTAKAHVRVDGKELFSRQDKYPFKIDGLRVVLDVAGSKGRVQAFGESFEFDVPPGGPAKGATGFDLSVSESGKLFLKRVALSSPEDPPKKEIGSWHFALGRDQGLVSPPVYDVTAWRYETGETRVECVLSGLLPDRPPREASGGGEWATLIDRVTEPYVKFYGADGSERTILFWNGMKEFKDPLMGYKPPVAWPARAVAMYRDFPDDFAIAAGYARVANNPWRFASDGPREQLRTKGGTLIREGQAIGKGRIAFKAASPADKKIVSRIPADLPERDRALKHAREGHYFLESETPRFALEVTWRKADFSQSEIVVAPRLESVYGDAVDVGVVPAGEPAMEDVGAGLVRRRQTFALTRNPGVGVWHLETEVGAGAGLPSRTERTVFEILSDDPKGPCPPLVSGLPELLSMPNEIKYLEESAFDPWGEMGGVSHYYAIDTRYPKVVARMRTWEADHVYGRKLFTWAWKRNLPLQDCDISNELCRLLIRNVDYFGGSPARLHLEQRVDFALARTYTGLQMDFLEEYLKEHGIKLKTLTPESIARHRKENSGLTQQEFREVYDTCWEGFKTWGLAKAGKTIQAYDERLLAINPKIARASYGPMPVYTSHYKSPYTLEYDSHPLDSDPRIKANGSFWLLEDYHYSCDYPMSRPSYFVAGYCLLHPESRRIFPEIYYEGWSRCLDGAVYNAHPDKYPRLAFTHQRRVAYQFVYGTPFMRADGSFGFWRDYGFHARNPEKEAMDQFLYAWGKVIRNPPAAPLKAPFVFADSDAMRRHGDFFEAGGCQAYLGCGWDDRRADVNNTAEEDVGYSYDRICAEGYVSPVVATLASLDCLTRENCEFAVLPPLVKGTPVAVVDAVRRAHARGINMMCFEEASGLEDLFDVSGAAEFARRETASGRTVFVKTPPSMVDRDSFLARYSRGRDTTSRRMDAEMKSAFAYLSPAPEVKTEHGNVLAARTEHGDVVAVLSEASPLYRDVTEYPVSFRFTVSAPGIGLAKIDADAPYSVVSREHGQMTIRTSTDKDTALFFRFDL